MPDPLIDTALAARLNAFVPYSKFLVEAAIEDSNGRIHTGCNELVLVNLQGKTETYQLKDLFPKPFDVSYL